jgi:ribonucleoside-diphosphate reductase alpha chain
MEGFSENALKILRARYFKKNQDGDLIEKKPSDLFKRVAKYIANAEKNEKNKRFWEDKFFNAMMQKDFMPNSPTLTGAGRGLCLSACFVLPIKDSLKEIFETVKNAALVHKEGGGTGFDFSKIRPQGSFVKKTQGIASGPISFLKVIDAGTEKLDGNTAQNFNISVSITDKFMKALKNKTTYDLHDPQSNKVKSKTSAQEIFDLIVNSAWKNGDPGLIFIDTVNKLNPTRLQGSICATNPCGEQPLHDYEACNLGSINLSNFFDPKCKDQFDWFRFKENIKIGVRFLDDVIDVNVYPLEEIDKMAKSNRRIGLGVMGLADLLIKMKIKYNTNEARKIGGKIVRFLNKEAVIASQKLAQERGNFPNIEKSIYKGKKMRNAALLTIAPTGTISRIAGCSSSIEPIFAFKVISKILDGEIKDFHPLYQEWNKKHPKGPVPDYFITASDISPKDHIKMQEVFQEEVDSAVSKTINFPNKATKKDIANAYLMAFDMKIKGITVYRDGCRALQVLYKAEKEEPRPQDRPDSLPSTTHKISTGFGNLYITISYFNGKPFEVFTSIGKSGYSTMADAEAIGRLTSLALRSGISADQVVNQLKGIGGSEPTFHNGSLVQSIPDAIAQVLERQVGKVNVKKQDLNTITCPIQLEFLCNFQ